MIDLDEAIAMNFDGVRVFPNPYMQERDEVWRVAPITYVMNEALFDELRGLEGQALRDRLSEISVIPFEDMDKVAERLEEVEGGTHE